VLHLVGLIDQRNLVPDDYKQLASWHDDVLARPPRRMSSLDIDLDAGVLRLMLSPDHDHAAVQSVRDRLPPDSVVIEVSGARCYVYDTGADPDIAQRP
jgi:hypothetical protein